MWVYNLSGVYVTTGTTTACPHLCQVTVPHEDIPPSTTSVTAAVLLRLLLLLLLLLLVLQLPTDKTTQSDQWSCAARCRP
jgi:hypothetical protein